MSSESQSSRKLAAILFADIVGYTKMMQSDEGQAMSRLRHYQQVLQSEVDRYQGQIVKNYGDGSLCVFSSVLDAVNCAKSIQEILSNEPKVPLRIGLHLGDIIYEANDIYGDALNIASRIESMGVSGAVLLSKDIYKKIKNQASLDFTSLGSFQFKNVEEPIEVFALSNAGFVVPTPEDIKGKGKFSNYSPRTPINKLTIPLIVGAIILGAWAIWQMNSSAVNVGSINQNNIAVATASIPDNSLAVLPFTSMSSDQENQYFTDGMHDDLLTHLSKISSMKIISRTSVNKYRETKKTLPEIGNELGVANILEGSVRRAGDQIRINVQLIKADSDEHLWSEIYDREVTTNNIFDIQTEIAKTIANVLKTTISSEQLSSLEERPTENLRAYEAFLRGRQLMEVRNSTSLNEAKELFEKAIDYDPDFALAYIHLGSVHRLLFEYAGADPVSSHQLAQENLEKGISINDNLAEAYALQGKLIGHLERDLDKATKAFEKAIAINVNYSFTYLWYGEIVRELTHDYKKALEIHEKGYNLNPLSPVLIFNLARYHAALGNKQKAIDIQKKGIKIEPATPSFWTGLGYLYMVIGQLDTAAIMMYEGIQTIKNNTPLKLVYQNALMQLNMNQELEYEVNSFQPLISSDEKMVAYIKMESLIYLKNDFDGALQFIRSTNALTDIKKSWLQRGPLYFKKQWKLLVDNYESSQPDLINGTHLSMFNTSDLQQFQEYIYALSQVGRADEAMKLWSKFGNPILNIPDDKNEDADDHGRRSLIKIRQSILEDRHDLAIEQFANLFNDGFLIEWQIFEIDPIIDKIKTRPETIQILDKIKAKVAVQRENFRAYLNGKG